ncbi:hypothetical protein HQ496_01840 [bacterium]|nr:hypothetical protein [bacterium]
MIISSIMVSFWLLLSPAGTAHAQNNGLTIFGAPSIRLTPVFHSLSESVATAEDESSIISWGRTSSKSKVTVTTFSPGQRFALFVEAKNATNGKSKGRIGLVDGMKATDFIVNIANKRPGSATLFYLAEVRIEEGSTETEPTDIHSVTYTLTDQ